MHVAKRTATVVKAGDLLGKLDQQYSNECGSSFTHVAIVKRGYTPEDEEKLSDRSVNPPPSRGASNKTKVALAAAFTSVTGGVFQVYVLASAPLS